MKKRGGRLTGISNSIQPRGYSHWEFEGFLNRGLDPTPSSGGAGYVYEPQAISYGRCGWGFYTVWGGIDPGQLRLRPRLVEAVEICKDF